MIITLCGSTQFESEFIEASRELSFRGILALTLAVMPCHRLEDDWGDDKLAKIMADLLYFERILHSDAILVLGDGYIGDSTAREILWAKIQGKRIYRRVGHDWDAIAYRFTQLDDDSGELVWQAKDRFK